MEAIHSLLRFWLADLVGLTDGILHNNFAGCSIRGFILTYCKYNDNSDVELNFV